jgi:hypothetical protein
MERHRMRRFRLGRLKDTWETVAEGIVFTDGSVALRSKNSVSFHETFLDLIHTLEGGAMALNWVDTESDVAPRPDKTVKSDGKICEDLSQQEGSLLSSGICPDCGHTRLFKGPSGGLATNFQCASCGQWFNECFPLTCQRIFKHSMDLRPVSQSSQLDTSWHERVKKD